MREPLKHTINDGLGISPEPGRPQYLLGSLNLRSVCLTNRESKHRKGVTPPMHDTEYYQRLNGRIRIKVPEIKGSPEMADELESRLAKLNGVTHVQVNPMTGYVLVLFDYQVISHYHVFAVINDLKCLNV